MNDFDKTKALVEKSNFDGYKAAFLGAMAGWEKSMQEAAYLLAHVTGSGNESVEHYWPKDCDTCAKVAKFISEWKIDVAIMQFVESQKGGRTLRGADGALLCDCGEPFPKSGRCQFCGAVDWPPRRTR